jgi:hypothetical protein
MAEDKDRKFTVAPPGMTGWLDEAELGEPLVLSGEGEMRIKIVPTENGISFFVLTDKPGEGRKVLESLGIPPNRILRMLCG